MESKSQTFQAEMFQNLKRFKFLKITFSWIQVNGSLVNYSGAAGACAGMTTGKKLSEVDPKF